MENAADHLGLLLVDLPKSPNRLATLIEPPHDAIAVGDAADRIAFQDAADLPALDLGGKVAEKQRVHGAFEADMQFVHNTFGQGDDLDTGKAEAFEQTGNVFLIAREPVQRLGQNDIEAASLRVGKECLDTGAKGHACPGNRGIGIGFDDLPAFALRSLPAYPQLILNRGFPLIVRGIAGIERNAGHGGYLRLHGGHQAALVSMKSTWTAS
nr:hypothetical protein [Sphingobium cloacae]